MINRLRRLLLTIRHALALWRTLNLPKNRCKGGWRDDDLRDLLAKLDRERDELWAACWEFEHGMGSAKRVAEKAADVSAFAAMVADKARSQDAQYNR